MIRHQERVIAADEADGGSRIERCGSSARPVGHVCISTEEKGNRQVWREDEVPPFQDRLDSNVQILDL